MWAFFAKIVLRNRLVVLLVIGLITAFFSYKVFITPKPEYSYQYIKLLPDGDSTLIEYNNFKKIFGEDGNIIIVGFKDNNFFEKNKFRDFYNLGNKIKKKKNVEAFISIAHCFNLVKDTTSNKFKIVPLISKTPTKQTEIDSIVKVVKNLTFYKSSVYNDSTNVYLALITLDRKTINSKSRIPLILEIEKELNDFSQKYNIETHISGLPFIRTITAEKVKKELYFFIFLTLLITIIVLYSLYRSFKIVLSSSIAVVIAIIWSLGILILLGYKLTVLTGLIPPFLIIVGIPDAIFLINRYHLEFRKHNNKIKALYNTISKLGLAMFLINLTTALGFATFIFTNNKSLIEFGTVASITIMLLNFITITVIPILFSLFLPPRLKSTKHLDNKIMSKIVEKLNFIITKRRPAIYIITSIIIILSIASTFLIKITGYVVDDIPPKDPIYKDLKFFEKNFGGVLPFEITIDTRKPKGVMKIKNIKKISKLQDELVKYPELSNPLSIAEIVKFARQAFYNGDISKYSIPSNEEASFIMSYIPKKQENSSMLNPFLDNRKQIARITMQAEDMGTIKTQNLLPKIKKDIEKIFPKSRYDVIITGQFWVFYKGTKYLLDDLLLSIIIGMLLIILVMFYLLKSIKLTIISIVPNIIPLIITAGLMGIMGVPLKASTIIIFSIAFGITVDTTIYFFAKFKQELKLTKQNIGESVILTLKDSAFSIIYTSVVLFVGFGVFILSDFGGTQALGLLVSIIMITHAFTNVIILPALILTLEKSINKKALKNLAVEEMEEEN